MNKKVPSEFKCRQLVPTSGAKSTSLWDVTDPEALLAWLNENIAVDCHHEIFEVQEDFGIGLGEVTRARAAERVTAAAGAAATATVHSVHDIDTKLRISERASHAAATVRESAVVQGTAAALTKVGSSVKTGTTKVLEQPAVQGAAEAVGSGFRKLGASLSSLSSKVISRRNSTGAADAEDAAGVAAGIPETTQQQNVGQPASPPAVPVTTAPPPPPAP